MFYANGDAVFISRGDTGTITATTKGSKLNPAVDRVLFTVKNNKGEIVMLRQLTPADDAQNTSTVEFRNRDTDYLTPGVYTYDFRYVVNPYYNADGDIVDGDDIITPKLPQQLTILGVVGEI